MSKENSEQPVLGHIDALIKEEERLYAKQELTTKDRTRLEALKVELDQTWDLLRQRRALREFGQDPNKAKLRSPEVVEDYEQ
jgi:hypothetical protein